MKGRIGDHHHAVGVSPDDNRELEHGFQPEEDLGDDPEMKIGHIKASARLARAKKRRKSILPPLSTFGMHVKKTGR
ncbi:MAG: hypothetical protein NT080_07400 [Spirochaetes bacterium]|nr:hypothetical protein [Spirochaetota bacterium]